jgi:hypothetical protein
MVVAIVAFAGSTAVWGVGPSVVNPFSYVAIEDPVSGNKVAVDAGRHLLVSDQLRAAEATPANLFLAHGYSNSNTCTSLASPPAGKALIVKSIIVDAYAVPASGDGRAIYFYRGGGCDSSLGAVNPASVGVIPISYEPGIAIPAGSSLWTISLNGVSGEITVTGYLVPASWAPALPTVSAASQPIGLNGG